MSKYSVRVDMKINADVSKVKALIADILSYPCIFPFYKDVAHIDGNIYCISANMLGPFFAKRGKLYHWDSEFLFNNTEYNLITHELSPKKPVKMITAYWSVNEENGSCRVILQHVFSLLRFPLLIGCLITSILQISIRINSIKILSSIRKAVI